MIIYYHKNLINGKYYVGQTSTSLEKRSRNGLGYIQNKKFFDDILKYGWGNFEHKVICECSKEDGDELERFYIQKFDSFNNGYNLATGGKSGYKMPTVSELNRQRVWTKESREKDATAHRGRKHTEETKRKLSELNKGEKNAMYGVVIPSSVIHIICVETGIEYYSIAECGRAMNLNSSHIGAVANGKRKRCGGYTFRHLEN